MTMKKPLIPFGWMPGHWGLKGSTREIAKAEYELTGLDLDLRLAEIRISDEKDLEREKLAIMRKHDLISADEYTKKVIDLAPIDDNQKKLEHLEHDLKSGKITQEQHDRRRADILGEPWVSMPRIHWNPAGKARAYFELEYNDHFIKQLRDNGYEGSDEDIVNQWMNVVCESILTDAFNDGEPFVAESKTRTEFN
jgi:hypothetical protein